MASIFLTIQVHEMVPNNIRMIQGFNIFKIFLQKLDVLNIHVNSFHCKQLVGGLEIALSDKPIHTLTNFLPNEIFLLKFPHCLN